MWVLEIGKIAGVLSEKHGPDHPPKNFSVSGLWQIRHHMHRLRSKRLTQLLDHATHQLAGERLTRRPSVAEDHEADQGFSLDRMRYPDRGCLAHRRMAGQDRFDFGRPEALAGHLDRVI